MEFCITSFTAEEEEVKDEKAAIRAWMDFFYYIATREEEAILPRHGALHCQLRLRRWRAALAPPKGHRGPWATTVPVSL